ncbi:Type IVB pilus formation outer membrane protein, R64 PilN family [Bordetella sputigena]
MTASSFRHSTQRGGMSSLRRIARRAVMLFLTAACPACVTPERIAAVQDRAAASQARSEAAYAGFSRSLSDGAARLAAQDVARPWLAGRARPLAREATLPAALRRNVDTTLMFAGGQADLAVLADRIARATGIGVKVRPDALLPAELFLPRLAVASGGGTAFPARASLPDGAQPLPRVLDALAWRLGVYWRYTDGAIEFYRTETRVFDVRALTLNARADARLGRAASAGEEGFQNTSNTTLSSGDHDAMDSVRARIEPFLTRAGTVTAAPGAGNSIVVNDTRDALEQVARFLERENKALTRRVRLVFEEITVVGKDQAKAGIDWNLLYQGARAAASLASAGLAGSSTGWASAGVENGLFGGSKAIIAALSEIGTIVRHSSVPVLTLNRRPVTHAVRTTFSYVDQVQGGVSGPVAPGHALHQGLLPTVSINQKQETVGSFLTLVPDAQDDGQILLSIAYDNTVAQPLKSLTFGKANNPLEVQQITIDGNGMVQQVELRAGQPMIISGFDRREDEYDRRRLTPGAPYALGGSDRASTQRATTVIIVTAQVEEGF